MSEMQPAISRSGCLFGYVSMAFDTDLEGNSNKSRALQAEQIGNGKQTNQSHESIAFVLMRFPLLTSSIGLASRHAHAAVEVHGVYSCARRRP